MIKGVNRQIIEISDTGNAYFERALLIVRSPCSDTSSERLHEEAQRLLNTTGGYSALRRSRRRRIWERIAFICCGGAAGLLVGLAVHLVGG